MQKILCRTLMMSCAITLTLTGCIERVAAPDLPKAPTESVLSLAPVEELQPYKLQIGDVLDIKFPLNPELDETVTVRPDGMISTASSTDIVAYNVTPRQLKEKLQMVYAKILQAPEMGVIVKSFAPTRFYVTGEVQRSGEFINVGPNLTLMQALSRAGGLKDTASIDDIVILRRGTGKDSKVFKTNFKLASSGADSSYDVRLAPYDVVFVPRSGIGNVGLHYNQYLQQFINPNASAVYQINPVEMR